MLRIVRLAVFAFLIGGTVGCKEKAATTPAPAPPGKGEEPNKVGPKGGGPPVAPMPPPPPLPGK